MKTIIFLLSGFLTLSITNTTPTPGAYTDLSGSWNIKGAGQSGYLNHNISIEDYGNHIDYYEVDGWGSSRKIRVKYFSKSSNKVTIKIAGDNGMGKYVSTYRLQIINDDLMKGSYVMEVAGWAGLPGMTFRDKVTFSR